MPIGGIGLLKATLIPCLALAVAGTVRADLITSETASDFGMSSQLNGLVAQPNNVRENSCVPTSVSNGLDFLTNTEDAQNLQGAYPQVNTLIADMGTTAAGTSFSGEVNGLATYINNQSSDVVIVGGQVDTATGYGTVGGHNIQNNTVPTALQLYNWLSAGDAVEFWIAWTTGTGTGVGTMGAHSVTLYGIDYNQTNGTGTLSFWDPFGGTAGGTGSAVNITSASFITQSGHIFINGGYSAGAANNGLDEDNPDHSSTGFIVTDLAETVAPEPATFGLMTVGLAAAAIFRKRRMARS